MRNIIFAFLLIAVSFLNSCSNENEGQIVQFTGSVRYIVDNSTMPEIPLKLQIFDKYKFDLENPVLTKYGKSESDGSYNFEFASEDLPKNTVYILLVDTDSLVQFNDTQMGCAGIGSISNELLHLQELNEIYFDYPTFLQLILNKVDHTSTDRVLAFNCRLVYGTTLVNPDTTFLFRRASSYIEAYDEMSYDVIKENGLREQYWIENIVMQKKDTTKIHIDY